MSTYTPDKWVIIELTSSKGTHQRVFASWYGGYMGSNSWKMSSGIEGSKLEDKFYIMPQTSGSTYKCHVDTYGMSAYSSSVLSSYINEADKSEGDDKLSIRLMTEEEASDFLKKFSI